MKKWILHLTNWTGYLVSIGVLSSLWGKLFGDLFDGFLTDEAYAKQHPKKFILGVIGIFILTVASGMLVIWWPLTKLMEFISDKIEDKFPENEEKEWD